MRIGTRSPSGDGGPCQERPVTDRAKLYPTPIAKVAKILGHKELMTTQRYAHLADKSLFEAVERTVQNGHDRGTDP